VKAILIGAGRGRRLMPLTQECPKGLVPFHGKRILDWILEALAPLGVDEIVYVGGWQADAVRRAYPSFTHVLNERWAETNILWSLLAAREHMKGGFVCSYVDIVYRPDPIVALAGSPHPATIVVDTRWRERYRERTQHPETDGEKVLAEGARVTAVGRWIDPAAATGEFIGVARFTEEGAKGLLEEWDRLSRERRQGPIGRSASREKAYLVDLFDEMLAQGRSMHRVDTQGDYFEIDTTEDYELAMRDWRHR
jgi:choline kinase